MIIPEEIQIKISSLNARIRNEEESLYHEYDDIK
jgi:hypothetical protein